MPNQIFYSPVDRPSLHVADQVFTEDVTIQGQPVYGRVLFCNDFAVIEDNVFVGTTLMLSGVQGVTVRGNLFTSR